MENTQVDKTHEPKVVDQSGKLIDLSEFEGRVIGKILRADGYKNQIVRNGTVVEEDIDIASVVDSIPKGFREKHRKVLFAMMVALEQGKKFKREIPVLREELEKIYQIDKKAVKELEKWGCLETKIVYVKDSRGMNMGGRLAVVLTSQGKGLIDFIFESIKAFEAEQEQQKTV